MHKTCEVSHKPKDFLIFILAFGLRSVCFPVLKFAGIVPSPFIGRQNVSFAGQTDRLLIFLTTDFTDRHGWDIGLHLYWITNLVHWFTKAKIIRTFSHGARFRRRRTLWRAPAPGGGTSRPSIIYRERRNDFLPFYFNLFFQPRNNGETAVYRGILETSKLVSNTKTPLQERSTG